MTRDSSKDRKPSAGFKTFINVLRPIRDWLKNTPDPMGPAYGGRRARDQSGRSSVNQVDRFKSSIEIQHSFRNNLEGASMLNQTVDPSNIKQRLDVEQAGTPEHTPFKRSAEARMSLPIMQHNRLRRQAYSQLQQRGPQRPQQSLGHIYLQYQGETKQANLPNELTTLDTIRALFVCAFPNLLSMEYMSQLYVKIYIYNPNCNIFYELHDIDDVRHESVLRIHQSDPLLALAHNPQQQYLARTLPRIPPPKPRRMIPINGLPVPPSPSLIYGTITQPNHAAYGYVSR